MVPLEVLVWALACLGSAGGISIGVLLGFYEGHPVLIQAISVLIALGALLISFLTFLRGEQKGGFTNALAIARKWEDEPLLGARKVLREYLLNPDLRLSKVGNDEAITEAVIHLTNFFWDMAVAIECGWSESTYLRRRFSATLEALFPEVRSFANVTKDKSVTEALKSIEKLRDDWSRDLDRAMWLRSSKRVRGRS